MSSFSTRLMVFLAASFAPETLQSVLAMGGGGPPVWTMTQNYCRETVYNKGVTEVTRFEQEVRKCMANPVTYPPAYDRPGRF